MQIKYYIVDKEYALSLLEDVAYRATTADKLSSLDRPNTPMAGIMAKLAHEMTLVSDEPITLGTYVVCDITLPKLPLPLRALAEVERTDASKGRVVDRTISTYHSGLKLHAVNADDLKRIENHIIEENIKQRMSGR